MNRDKYGFPDDSLTFHKPFEYETVTISEPVSFAALAKCADITTDSLRKINPELIRNCTPPREPYKLKLYPGMGQDFMRRYAALSDEDKQIYLKHTVARGETLGSISAMYGVSLVELSEINGISGYRTRLRSGTTLRVPVRSSSVAATTEPVRVQQASQAAPSSADSTARAGSDRVVQADAPSSDKGRGMREGVAAIYVVERGDNLSSISEKFNVRIADLRNWNNIPYNRDALRIGDTLVVGTPSGVQKTRVQPEQVAAVEQLPRIRTQRHTVRKGETIAKIAARYKMTPARLASINNIRPKARVKPGTILLIEVPRSRTAASQVAAEPEGKGRPKTYRVKKGDTISSIADRFSMSIAELRKKNPLLRKSDVLRYGQVVRLD